jgi:hypothetical protein
MAYCTYTDIQSDFKSLTFASGSGNVTQEDVTQFIVEADALINSYVSGKYETPVAAGDGLNLLKMISRNIVTLRVKSILEVKQSTNVAANQNPVSTSLSMKQCLDMLGEIKAGKLKLDGATALVSGGGFYSSNYANDITPVIKKDSKLW